MTPWRPALAASSLASVASPGPVSGVSVLIAVGVLVVLTLLWVFATRRHERRRRRAQREWEDAERRPELWTSAARCPECQHSGGLLEFDADGALWFVCLHCQHRHRRETRG